MDAVSRVMEAIRKSQKREIKLHNRNEKCFGELKSRLDMVKEMAVNSTIYQ